MRQLLAIPLILFAMKASAFVAEPVQAIIPPGTNIQVRSDAPVDVATWDKGRIYPAHIAQDVFARDGALAIPRGSYCELIVRQIGPRQLALDLESVTANGRRYVLDTTGPEFQTHRYDESTDRYENGAALIGNILGVISGENGAKVEYNGDRVRLPAGAVITFQLQAPLHVVTWEDPGYMRDNYHYHRDQDWYR